MNRRDRNAEVTRGDIMAAGLEIFTQHPYCQVSGLQICERARVTRGALHHHFGSKQGLFVAVLEDIHLGAIADIVDAAKRHVDPWSQVRAGIAAFLDACTRPAYQAVVLKEGPGAIGWGRWRELDTAYYSHLVRSFTAMMDAGWMGGSPAAMLAATMRGTLTELSFAIAQSGDPTSARREALALIEQLLTVFRSAPSRHAGDDPLCVGIGQLRASTGAYLVRAAGGQPIDVVRRGRIIARIQQSPYAGHEAHRLPREQTPHIPGTG